MTKCHYFCWAQWGTVTAVQTCCLLFWDTHFSISSLAMPNMLTQHKINLTSQHTVSNNIFNQTVWLQFKHGIHYFGALFLNIINCNAAETFADPAHKKFKNLTHCVKSYIQPDWNIQPAWDCHIFQTRLSHISTRLWQSASGWIFLFKYHCGI